MISLPRPLRTIYLAAIILIASGGAKIHGEDCLAPNLTGIFRSGNFPANYDEFASAVAANENVMVVGARADGRSPAGALHIYTKQGATWEKQQRLRILDNPSANFLGEVLALDGDSIVAGLPESSRVHVFAREGTNWTPRQTVAPSNMLANTYFGHSVAVADDIMVVGAPGENNVMGAAYIFIRAGTNWIESVKLLASDGRAWDGFGWSVAVDGDRVLVGSGRHTSGSESGIGYVFRRGADGWTEEARLFPDNSKLYHGEISVCMSGENAAINYRGFPNAVHLFRRTNEVWTRTQKIVATNASMEGGFGFSLQMIGTQLAIGSPASSVGGGGYHGRVHLFTRQGSAWLHHQTIESIAGYTQQYFGRAISLYSNGLLVGAHGLDSGPDRSGTAFLYEFDIAPPVIASASAAPSMLWPPNHKMVPVRIEVAAHDECGPVACRIIQISSDNLITEDDWEITGDLSVNLRATLNKDGTDRVYHIAIECVDGIGYTTTTNVMAIVPHDLRNRRRN